jgi:hypothetical protein
MPYFPVSFKGTTKVALTGWLSCYWMNSLKAFITDSTRDFAPLLYIIEFVGLWFFCHYASP